MESVVKVTSNHPACRPGGMTCSFGTIDFNEAGEAEITKAHADMIREVRGLTFSDAEEVESIEEIVAEEIVKEAVEESKVLGMESMPAGLVDPIPEIEESNEVKSESDIDVSVREDSSSDNELLKLSKDDLREVCVAAGLTPASFNSLNKKDLIKLIETQKLV